MSSWFDEFEKSQADTATVEEDTQAIAGSTRAASSRRDGRDVRTTMWLIPVLAVIALWAAWYLMNAGNDTTASAEGESAQAGSSSSVVEMAPVDPDTQVAVDLMVTFADGSSQTYQQTVVGAQGPDGTWLIDDIVTR